MRLRHATLAAALALAASPAAAADYGYIEPLPFRGAIYDWTGAYAGGHVGWGYGDFRAKPTPFLAPFRDMVNRDSGIVAGVQAGYNFQLDEMVLGLEADISYASIRSAELHFNTPVDIKADWLATLRGRLGYAFDNILVYATGGLAGTGISANIASPTRTIADRSMHLGWVAGAGVEIGGESAWTSRIEYLYHDFSSKTYGNTAPFTADIDPSVHVVRAAVNYRFQ